MNSFLQQMYAIPKFRKAIFEVTDRNTELKKEDNFLYQLKV